MQSLTRRQLLRYVAGVTAMTALPTLLTACGGDDTPAGSGVPPTPSANAQPTEADEPAGNASPTSAASPASPASAASPGPAAVDLVRFAWQDSGTPTPFRVSPSGPGGAVLLSLIYDTLTWKDEGGIIPWLASSWDASEDGTIYTFEITDTATWHDDQPLTADDVVFSFTYYATHPYTWMTTEIVGTSEVDEDGNVRITLQRPYTAFLEDIAGVVPIVPRHIWESVDDPIAYDGTDASTGSGPFRLAEYNATEAAYRLLANDGYWRGTPLVREWQQIAVPNEARVLAVQEGDVDISFTPDASVVDVLADDARLKVHETAPHSIVRLAVNTERAPLERREVRQAIAYAIDRDLLAETITRGPAVVGNAGVIPPETPWFNPDVTQYDFDPVRARELLDGETYTIELIADANSRESELLKPMLEAVGITLNVQSVDSSTRVQLLDEGNFDLALIQHIGVSGDPDFLRRWYAGEEGNAFAKGSIFENEEFSGLGEQEAAELDSKKRRGIIFRMQEILAEELPTIVLYHRRFYWIYDPAVFTPMETWGGLMNGIPLPNNKLGLID